MRHIRQVASATSALGQASSFSATMDDAIFYGRLGRSQNACGETHVQSHSLPARLQRVQWGRKADRQHQLANSAHDTREPHRLVGGSVARVAHLTRRDSMEERMRVGASCASSFREPCIMCFFFPVRASNQWRVTKRLQPCRGREVLVHGRSSFMLQSLGPLLAHSVAIRRHHQTLCKPSPCLILILMGGSYTEGPPHEGALPMVGSLEDGLNLFESLAARLGDERKNESEASDADPAE